MYLLPFLFACVSSELTITDLTDPEGHLGDSSELSQATWFQSDGGLPTFWAIDSSTSTLYSLGEVEFIPLGLMDSAGACDDLADRMALSAALVEGLVEGEETPTADACDAVSTFMDGLGDEAAGDLSFWAGVSDLGEGGGGAGTYTDAYAWFSWSGASEPTSSFWDSESCTLSPIPGGESVTYELEDVEIVLDEVTTDDVVGSLSGSLGGENSASGDVELTFDATMCFYGVGDFVTVF